MMFYDLTAKNIRGEEIPMSVFKGKTLLIVNTASKCGFTPQFSELEELYKNLKEKDFTILGFPCNQFLNQDPKSNAEINNFCQLNYGVTFPMFEKIDVNGTNEHPIYKFLKKEQKGLVTSKIKWNFTKFLLDSEGNVVKRYSPFVKPSNIEEDIKSLLK
ncbi:MAG: glutathione peroxidase [Clostridium sp.]|uniref:glutathione peroxidase n=1 Tax=Clostridium sp. TaxID=1506 RepID=UPI003EE59218